MTGPAPSAGGGGGRARCALALVALSTAACAGALNYLEPSGPLYQGQGTEAALCPGDPNGATLRVVTFNIEYGRQIDRALEVLRGSEPLRRPDLLALQEMDAPGVERIARGLGLGYVYFPSGVHPKTGRDFGCALLSPWPLEDPRKIVLPHGARGSGLRRSAVAATLVRGTQRVRVYTVHLPSPLAISGGSRRDEVRVLIADASSSPLPVVVAGDFNSSDVGQEFVKAGYRWLTRDVRDTTRLALFGIPVSEMSYDHVFAKGLLPAGGGAAAGVVRDNRKASDHRPVWAVLVPAPEGAPAP